MLGLSKEQEERFEKYALYYSMQEPPSYRKESDEEKVERQKYLYKTLKNKRLADTAIEDLIRMTETEINLQYVRKEHFENRAGFLLALWGILLGVITANTKLLGVFQAVARQQNDVKSHYLVIMPLIIITGAISLYFICRSIAARKYKHFDFDDRENNFKCAVEDKKLFKVVQLEALTNAWKENDISIKDKARNFRYALVSLAGYTVCIAISFLV